MEEHTFKDGVNACINLVEDTITLWLRSYYEDQYDTVEDILEDLKRKMKDLLR